MRVDAPGWYTGYEELTTAKDEADRAPDHRRIEAAARAICESRGYDPDALGWRYAPWWNDGLVMLTPTDMYGETVMPVPVWRLFEREASRILGILSAGPDD